MSDIRYQYRLNEGSPVDLGTSIAGIINALFPNTTYDVQVRSIDPSGNISEWTNVVQGTTLGLLFDQYAMAGAALWDLQKVRSDYAGPAVRVRRASDSVETDIGFNVDGSFDFVTYSAFGTGNERVIKRYDQSGNAFHIDVPYANNVKVRQSTYNGKACIYGNAGHGSNPIFAGWNGQANYNLIQVERMLTTAGGQMYSGGTDLHAMFISAGSHTLSDNGGGGSNHYTDEYAIATAGKLWRIQFNGAGATNALKLRAFSDERELAAVSGAGIGATSVNETGIFLNSTSGNVGARDIEAFGVYFLPIDLTATWAVLKARIKVDYLNPGKSQIMGLGDSLIVSYPFNGNPAHAVPEHLGAVLAGITGTSWTVNNMAEVATETARFLQVQQLAGRYIRDIYLTHDIAVCDTGTNDLANGKPVEATWTSIGLVMDELRAQGLSGKIFAMNLLPRTDLGAGSTFDFAPADVNVGTGNIHHVAHGLTNLQSFYFTTTGGLPLGLLANTEYFIIRIDADNYKIATSYANALAATAITGGTTGTGTHTTHWGLSNTLFEWKRQRFNPGLAAALGAGVFLIDVAAAPELQNSNDPLWYPDNVHGSAQMYDVIEQLFFATISAQVLGAGDSTAPTKPAGLTVTATSSTVIGVAFTGSTDNVAVARYQYRVNGGAWINNGLVLSFSLTGLTPLTNYTVDVRAVDYAGNVSAAASGSDTTLAPGLVLDGTATTIWGAYSVEKRLKTSYTGPLIRVKDNAGVQADIGYNGSNVLDLTALSGSAPYTIQKIYDQSGNARDLIKGGVIGQQIALDTADRSGTFNDAFFTIPDMSALTAGEIFLSQKLDADPNTPDSALYILGNSPTAYIPFNDGNIYDDFGSTVRKNGIAHPAGSMATRHVYNVYSAVNDWANFLNGVQLFHTSVNSVFFPVAPIYGRADTGITGVFFKGRMYSMVILATKGSGGERSSITSTL